MNFGFPFLCRLLHSCADRINVVQSDRSYAAEYILVFQSVAEDQGKHGSASVSGIFVRSFETDDTLCRISRICQLLKLLLCHVGGDDCHIFRNISAGLDIQSFVRTDHGAGADTGDNLAVRMRNQDGFHGCLGSVCVDCGLVCDNFILAVRYIRHSFQDTFFALFQDRGLRIADNGNLSLVVLSIVLVDELTGQFADRDTKVGIVQNPVSVGVGHRVVPAHNLDAGILCFLGYIFNSRCIRRMNHDQVAAGGNEVFHLADLGSGAAAAADSELWASPELSDFICMNISIHLGATIIHDRKILPGKHGYSGTIEHIQIVPNGKKCYCGRQGCIETVCSMNALLGEDEEDTFFEKKEAGDPAVMERWRTYLYYLALSINNMHLLYNEDFVLGGYLASRLYDADLACICENIEKLSPFPENIDYIHVSKMPKHNITIGAALPYIRNFLAGELIPMKG